MFISLMTVYYVNECNQLSIYYQVKHSFLGNNSKIRNKDKSSYHQLQFQQGL